MRIPRVTVPAILALALAGAAAVPASAETNSPPNPTAASTPAPAPVTPDIDRGASPLANIAATKQFTWSATFDHLVHSRNWKMGANGQVRITVNSISNCKAGTMKLRLWSYNSTLDHSKVGVDRAVSCTGGVHVWSNLAKGHEYYFTLWDTNTSDKYKNHKTTGTVIYP